MDYSTLIGKVFAHYTVIDVPEPGRKHYVLCRCICGAKRRVYAYDLYRGNSKSCGCMKAAYVSEARKTHGHCSLTRASHRSGTPEYRAWQHAKSRCYNPKDRFYPDYGARGIIICDRWLHSFEAFLEDMGLRPAGMSIDRKDVNGNYEPSNCRWATKVQQSRNTRTNTPVEFMGASYPTLSALAEKLGLRYKSLHHFYKTCALPLEVAVGRATPLKGG